MRYAMIMAGGAGTRLWPMSRQEMPKQLVPFIEDDGVRRCLLEFAAQRLDSLVDPDKRYICTNEAYRAQIKDRLPSFTDAQLLGEPVGRDTVNAVGFAAAVLHKLDKDAVFAVLTADHLIRPDDEFRRLMAIGFDLVEQDPRRLVTFSIKPTFAATGFGYVERGNEVKGHQHAFYAERFVEKPSLEKAQAYLESGAFGWNSGMVVWKAATILDCLRRYCPESYEGLTKIADAWGTKDQSKVLNEVYPSLPKISVDYAIMEPASREFQRTRGKADAGAGSGGGGVQVCTVEMDLEWLDVGSWPAYGETLDADPQDNRISGNATLKNSLRNLVVNDNPNHRIAMIGCDNLIVVHTKDATLIMPASKAQDLKALHAELPENLR